MKKVVLFGATEHSFASVVVDKYRDRIAYFVDNDKNKHGKTFLGYQVFPVSKLSEDNGFIVFIVTYNYINQIRNQLGRMGLVEGIDFKTVGLSNDVINLDKYWDSFERPAYPNMPYELNVELSGACNLHCTHCSWHGVSNRKVHKYIITDEIIEEIVKQAKEINTFKLLNILGRGETFVDQRWYEHVSCLLDGAGIDSLTAFSNGMLLNRENIYKLSKLACSHVNLYISIDGESPQENDLLRKGSSYEVIKKNVAYAIEKLPLDRFKIIITNNHIIDETFIYNEGYVCESIAAPKYLTNDFPELSVYSRATLLTFNESLLDSDAYYMKRIHHIRAKKACDFIFGTISIDCEGNYHKCKCRGGADQPLGNILQQNMLDIYKNSPWLLAIRDETKNGKEYPSYCRGCHHHDGSFCVIVRRPGVEQGRKLLRHNI